MPESIFRLWTGQITQAPDESFFEELVSGLVRFLAARAGAIWIVTHAGLKMEYCYKDAAFPGMLLDQERSVSTLQQVIASGQSLIGRQSAFSRMDESEPDPNDCLLLAVPVKQKKNTKAILQIIPEPGALVADQASNLRFLETICKIANDRICELANAYVGELAISDSAPKINPKRQWWKVWK